MLYSLKQKIIQILAMVISIIVSVSGLDIVTVTFKDTVVVSGASITLADIATIVPDGAATAKLSLLSAGEAAPAGYSRFVNGRDLLLLKEESVLPGKKIEVVGVSRTLVKTAFQDIAVSSHYAAIEKFVRDKMTWGHPAEVTLNFKGADRLGKLLQGNYTVKISGEVDKFQRGSVLLMLSFEHTASRQRIQLPATVYVTVRTSVLTAEETILRETVILPGMLVLKNVDITAMAEIPLVDAKDVVGKLTARTLPPGTVITARAIKNAPAVLRGELVRISVKRGSVGISLSARARQDGYVGDHIWVENLNSHKLIQVKVTQVGTVTLMEGEKI